uniref:Solute carrier family 37 member 1 n=1 Tax=Callorhinchus milii TaxID=7868 RepID=A0A4W3KCD5_CALMI
MPLGIVPVIPFLALSPSYLYRTFTLILTFLLYASYHLSRKPISIVKLELYSYKEYLVQAHLLKKPFPNDTWCSWQPFEKSNYKQLLGALDYSFLCAYAVGMYASGIIGERLPLRLYLTFGMLSSGLFTALFGLGYFYRVHNLHYYILVQVANGLVQTTGWPSVVTCIGNWFGKGRRGLIMGIWNSHTSVGNILGSLIAGYWVSGPWGLSFVVPGLIIGLMGVVCFFFLIERECFAGDSWFAPFLANCEGMVGRVAGWERAHAGRNRGRKGHQGTGQRGGRDSEFECFLNNVRIPAKPSSSSSHVVITTESGRGTPAISFLGALRIPGVVEFSLCLLFAKLVSYTFLFWLPMYLANAEHFDAKKAGDLSTLFDVGGIIGGIFAGLFSDYTRKRASTCALMLLLAAPTVSVNLRCCQAQSLLPAIMLIGCGALVNGPYSLITTAVSTDLGTHTSLMGNSKALSTVTAIIDGTGSIGAALGPLLAGLISPTGWNNVFYMLMAADTCAFLLLSRLVLKELHLMGTPEETGE